VGSTNLDIRSLRLNDEASLNVYGGEFAAQMTRVFEADLNDATPYAYEKWLRRPWTERVLEMLILPIKSQI
jgi:cardiolipin synthase